MPDTKITARGLNRATLARQLLLHRESSSVADAVRRVVALQAQEPASPYVALWNRVSDFDPADLDSAFATGDVVKATLIRVTLHAVHVDDYRAFREAMEPTLRAARLHDRRFAASGLTLDDADRVVPELVDYLAEPRSVTECATWLEQRVGAPAVKGAWWAFRQYAPLLHVPGGGPWSFGTRRSFVAPRDKPIVPDTDVAEESMRVLAWRYLEGFGPASAARHRPVRHGPPAPGEVRFAGARRRSPAARGAERRGAVRRSGRAAPRRGHTGTAEVDGDVGQRPARPRGPQPDHPA